MSSKSDCRWPGKLRYFPSLSLVSIYFQFYLFSFHSVTAEVKLKKINGRWQRTTNHTHTMTTTNSNYKMKSNTATQNKVPNKMMTVTGGGFPKTKRSALHKSGMKKKWSVFSKSTMFITDA